MLPKWGVLVWGNAKDSIPSGETPLTGGMRYRLLESVRQSSSSFGFLPFELFRQDGQPKEWKWKRTSRYSVKSNVCMKPWLKNKADTSSVLACSICWTGWVGAFQTTAPAQWLGCQGGLGLYLDCSLPLCHSQRIREKFEADYRFVQQEAACQRSGFVSFLCQNNSQ